MKFIPEMYKAIKISRNQRKCLNRNNKYMQKIKDL